METQDVFFWHLAGRSAPTGLANCPLDRVLTYKNLIYLLNLQFSLRKHHLDLFVADTALKVSLSLYCYTTSISHGVENNFPRLRGKGISDAIFSLLINAVILLMNCLVLILHLRYIFFLLDIIFSMSTLFRPLYI